MSLEKDMRRAKIGDFFFFTLFDCYEENAKDVWGVVTLMNAPNDPYVVLLPTPAPDDPEPYIEWCIAEHDRGRLVPEDEVPDHIWAELAKWRLLNG